MNFNRLPVVVIAGRPNVGKSMLFNRLLGKKVAITHEQSGVTRDRLYRPLEWAGQGFFLADTGGVALSPGWEYGPEIFAQVEAALAEAGLILFLVDAGAGLADEDRAALRKMKAFRGKMVLVANKSDLPGASEKSGEFYALGLGEAKWVSALHGAGIGDLLDFIVSRIRPAEAPAPAAAALKVAILGRPNVGKSTLVNAILGEPRMIADARPGTTRDSVDTYLLRDGREICLIDTAGLRKKARVHEPLEYYAGLRARGTLERCDVALVLLDGEAGLEQQDLKIFQSALDLHKGIILGINKWDLLEKGSKTFDNTVKEMARRHPKVNHVPVIALSAKTGLRVAKVVDLAVQIGETLEKMLDTQALQDFLDQAVSRNQPQASRGKPVTLTGIIQTGVKPLVFEIGSNKPGGIFPNYVRYLENRFYERFEGLLGCPIRLKFMQTRKAVEAAV